MLNRIIPNLTKIPGNRRLWSCFPCGSNVLRVRYGVFSRPYCTYGVCAAADLAERRKIDKIGVGKHSVAGGRGLFALKAIAAEVSRALNIPISVHGF